MAQKKRLAETLVEEGVITELQLQNALQRQLIMGGKIGTNLLELKYVSDKELEGVLSKIYRVPTAPLDSLLNIPPSVINSIPQEFAVKHKVIPIRRELKEITVAMENPNNLGVIDEMSFVTGCRVAVVVASELRIALGLEKYYQHPREVRYIKVGRPEEEQFIIERDTAEVLELTEEVPTIKTGGEEWLGTKDEESEPLGYDEGKGPLTPLNITFQETVGRLLRGETRDDAIKAVLDYISQYTENVIFLVVSLAEAKAWDAKCKGIENNIISDLKVSFGGPSIFLTVKNSEKPYYGEISGFPFDDDFLSRIGRKRPLDVLLFPVMLKTRMVAMLYADNGSKESPAERVEEIGSLIEKLSIAFEILLLKKKTGSKR